MSDHISMPQHIKMKDLPPAQRPYERCVTYGASSLSDEELLALIFRSGTGNLRVTQMAGRVLELAEEYGGLAYIDRIPEDDLKAIAGIGAVRLVQLKCLGELSKRMASRVAQIEKPRIHKPGDVYALFVGQLQALENEEVWALYLDGANAVLKKSLISKGTVNASLISGRELFKEAVRIAAAGIVMVHNHPSGVFEPSFAGIQLTKRMVMAGQLLDVEVIDHVIIGRGGFCSLKEKGVI